MRKRGNGSWTLFLTVYCVSIIIIATCMSWCWIYYSLQALCYSRRLGLGQPSTVKIQYGPQRTSPFKLTMDISHSSIIIMYPWFYGGGVIRIWQYTDVLSAVLFKFIINSKLQYSISLIKLLMIKMMRTRNINMGSCTLPVRDDCLADVPSNDHCL